MNNSEQLWTLMQDVNAALEPFYRETMDAAIQKTEVAPGWFPLNFARGAHPAPFTLERCHAMVPYSAPSRLSEMLESLVSRGFMERVGEGAYRPSAQGLEAIEDIFHAAQGKLALINALPAADMARLNGLLLRMVKATLESPEPKDKWAIAYSRWTDPGKGAAPCVLTDQYITDIARYRDDAHIGAWSSYGVGGRAWEALTFVWRGDARTAAQLAEKLPNRGHSAESYAEALHELAARGWVHETSDGYAVTEKGAALRQAAEDATNRLFFAPWACLSDAESDELQKLLARLRDTLRMLSAGK